MGKADTKYIRVEVSNEQVATKEKINVPWNRIIDLGVTKALEILKEVKELDMIGAYTVAWITPLSNVRLVPDRRSAKGSCIPILLYYVITLSVNGKPRYRLFYKEDKKEEMKQMDIANKRLRYCVKEEFGIGSMQEVFL